MYLIKPSVEIITPIDAPAMMARIEAAARTCYRSEAKITPDSAPKMIKSLITRGHESVLEHESISVRIICDRGVMAELTRQRHNSFSIESTRYVSYNKRGMTFVIPPWVSFKEGEYNLDALLKNAKEDISKSTDYIWMNSMLDAEFSYNKLSSQGWTPEKARSVLPNSLATTIVTTANIRQWRTVLKLRTAKAAHPQAREVMNDFYDKLIAAGLGVFFEDIQPYRE